MHHSEARKLPKLKYVKVPLLEGYLIGGVLLLINHSAASSPTATVLRLSTRLEPRIRKCKTDFLTPRWEKKIKPAQH